MWEISFKKMHGLGNDFVFIEKTELKKCLGSNLIENLEQDSVVRFIKKICDRRLGIGCDQLILYSQLSEDACEMIIYNQDGTSAEACGNATRALMLLLYEKDSIISTKVFVSGRELSCAYDKNTNKAIVDMGVVSLEKDWMPKKDDLLSAMDIYRISGVEFMCVDVGNPHLVIFRKFFDYEQYALVAKEITNSNLFKQGVNINFVVVKDKELHLRSWERGLDNFSLACGSGACASFAAAYNLGYVDKKCKVIFEIGELELFYGDDMKVVMKGEATKVFDGTYYYFEK